MSLKWQIYFALIAIQSVGAFTALFMFDLPINLVEVINYIFILVGTFGLFGYVYSKNIGTKYFWRIFLPAFILWDIYFLFLWTPQKSEIEISAVFWGLTCLLFLFTLPQYLGLYRYGYRQLLKP